MTRPLILILLAAAATPAAAQDATIREIVDIVRIARLDQDRTERDIQRERERIQRERERAQERVERERARASQRQDGIQEVERQSRTLKIGSEGELHLANVAGDILISRGSGSEAVVEIVKTGRGRTVEEARESLGLVAVDVTERGSRGDVRVRYPSGEEMRKGNRRNVNVSVALNVTVPAATRVRASSISGNISAKDIKGDVVLRSVSGTVRVANGGGVSEAESISGNIEVSETEMGTGMTASSASGNIVLRRVKARQLRLNSISGSVLMEDVDSARVEAQTVSGEVKFGGALPKNSRFEFGSHSGTIAVAVSGGGFELEATSFSGSVRSDFQFTSSEPDGFRRRGHSLHGVHGDGSAVLELNTFSGSIVISKR